MKRLSTLVATVVLAACGAAGSEPQMPAPAVSAAQVITREVSEWDEFTGRIEAVDSVELRPRVTGYVKRIAFDEGQLVQAGDLLFEIDDREYRAAWQRADADVERAQARAELARRELQRAERLIARKLIAQDQFDLRRAELRQAEADVAAARAGAQSAKIDLDYTRVTSPIAGRAGKAEVTVGNLVSNGMPGATLLTTVVSVDPVYVEFEGDEQTYLRYQALARSGERASSRDIPNPVRMGLANDLDYPHRGQMDFVDNQLDPATGTIRGRAVFPNPDGYLTPGLFARVRLLGSGSYTAHLVHDRAVMTDQDRRFVWVVGPNGEALRRDVELGPKVDGLRVVVKGLDGSESVIVNGTQKVFFPGMPVAPHPVPMDAPETPIAAIADSGAPAGQ